LNLDATVMVAANKRTRRNTRKTDGLAPESRIAGTLRPAAPPSPFSEESNLHPPSAHQSDLSEV